MKKRLQVRPRIGSPLCKQLGAAEHGRMHTGARGGYAAREAYNEKQNDLGEAFDMWGGGVRESGARAISGSEA